MKNKILLATTIAALLMVPTAFAGYSADQSANVGTNDDADDTQWLSVTVPEVALLDIADTPVSVGGLTPPTNAGDGFTGEGTGSSTYAISSNVKNTANPPKRAIEVTVVEGSIPAGAKLEITVQAPAGGTDGTATLTGGGTGGGVGCGLIGGIIGACDDDDTSSGGTGSTTSISATDIGNTRGTGLNINYKLTAQDTENGMIAYTVAANNIKLLYTLTNDD